MKLFHLTCEHHLSNIVRERRLRTTTADLDFYGNGPAVVWLTTDGQPAQGWQHIQDHTRETVRKDRVRITVDLPDYEPQRWVPWALKHGAERFWIGALIETGQAEDGPSPSDAWYIVTHPVTWKSWDRIEVINDAGEWSTLWDRADGPLKQLDGMLPGWERKPTPKPARPQVVVNGVEGLGLTISDLAHLPKEMKARLKVERIDLS